MGSWWSFTSSIEYVASAYYCLYSSFLHPWIRSTSAEAVATSDFCYANGGFTLFDCNRFVRRRQRRPHPYYWNLPRPCNSWFEIHFQRRNIPEEFFIARWECHATRLSLLVTLGHKVQREDTRLRNCIPPEKVLAIGLYRLAHGGSFSNAGIAMNVGKATVREAFTDVVNALYDFRNDFIKFPANEVETRASIETFEGLSDLPNIAGAIDGTHKNKGSKRKRCRVL